MVYELNHTDISIIHNVIGRSLNEDGELLAKNLHRLSHRAARRIHRNLRSAFDGRRHRTHNGDVADAVLAYVRKTFTIASVGKRAPVVTARILE